MRAIALLAAVVLAGCASAQVTTTPGPSGEIPTKSQAATFIGKETVGWFRTWERRVQSAYVLGFRSVAKNAGLNCERITTIGETVDTLISRQDFTPEMTVHKALMTLLKENKCSVPDGDTSEEQA